MTAEHPSVSIVIPMLDAADTIQEQLEALEAQSYDGRWEVVVADNGSTDGGPAKVRSAAKTFNRLRLVDASDIVGVSHARNVGIRETDGELILFCDADDVVRAGWISALVSALTDADIVGGRIDTRHINDATAQAWSGPGPMSDREPRSALRRHRGGIDFAISANCGVRREVCEAIGGWKSDYEGCEDVDFSLRAQLAGYRIAAAPDAVIDYRLRSDLGSLARTYFRYGQGAARFHREQAEAQRTVTARSGRTGLPAAAPKDGASVLSWLLRKFPRAVTSRTTRGLWVRTLAHAIGFAVGSRPGSAQR